MDHFRVWKTYVRAMETALSRAGYSDSAEFSVHRTDACGAAGARWSWSSHAPDLTSGEWPAGLDLEWDSATGWGFKGRNEDRLVPLPVPPLAAPDSVIALLPALMDGRRGQLPASEDRWEHAAAVMDLVKTSSLYDDDKYDADYQRLEEEAAHFLTWQGQVDGVLSGDVVSNTAARTDDGARAASWEGVFGGSRPCEPGADELARRRHVNLILDAAIKEHDGQARYPDPEMFGVLTDYFTRTVVFPGQLRPDDGQFHTSDPSRALAHLLVQYLERQSLDLASLLKPESSAAPVGNAVGECVAQALRASRWFDFAESDTGGDRVKFRTVFGTEGVLRLADAFGNLDGSAT
ncbi:hypothetical protein ABZ896_12500 [Streptomyces sp. NPDC047072]|uniref:hypothetical protein n=1 Tax=Streptomyces sp. NPDC047072 TaxID=3154809 RepID=UPI0033ED64C5